MKSVAVCDGSYGLRVMRLSFCACFAVALTLWCRGLVADELRGFRIATYNVENLFDLDHQGTEYPEYVPGGASGWNADVARIKYSHIVRVLAELNADIVGLQEVESDGALIRLQRELQDRGRVYPYRAFSKSERQTVGCALLSRFPIKYRQAIPVDAGRKRSILRVDVEIQGRPLILYVNHWKSKNSPESSRISCARALASETSSLKPGTDYVILGDLNSNYNEFQTFMNDSALNDTQGITGINHVLGTLQASGLVAENDVTHGCDHCHYDLWLEISPDQRWSHEFFGLKGSLDHILVPASLYDGRGIDYQHQSFKRFMPDYLFQGKTLERWRLTDRGRGRHMGTGYSDHLPIYADFTVG